MCAALSLPASQLEQSCAWRGPPVLYQAECDALMQVVDVLADVALEGVGRAVLLHTTPTPHPHHTHNPIASISQAECPTRLFGAAHSLVKPRGRCTVCTRHLDKQVKHRLLLLLLHDDEHECWSWVPAAAGHAASPGQAQCDYTHSHCLSRSNGADCHRGCGACLLCLHLDVSAHTSYDSPVSSHVSLVCSFTPNRLSTSGFPDSSCSKQKQHHMQQKQQQACRLSGRRCIGAAETL